MTRDDTPLDKAGRSAAWCVAAAWLWMMGLLASAALLLSEQALPGGIRLSAVRAVFQAVSAGTLTGYATVPALRELKPYGQAVLLTTAYLSATLTLVLGALLTRRVAGLSVSRWAVAAVAAAMPALGLLLGAVCWPSRPWDGAVLGLSAVSHSGLAVEVLPAGDVRVVGVLLPLALAGGVGAVVVVDVWLWLTRRGHRCRPLTRWTVVGACVVLWGLTTVVWLSGGAGWSELPRSAVRAAADGGWGYPAEGRLAGGRGAVVLMMAAMWWGVGVGAASGGVGLYVAAVWLRGAVSALRGGPADRVAMRPWGVASMWLAGQAVLTAAVLVALLQTEPQLAFDRVLLLAVGSVSLAGVSADPVAVVGPGLLVMSGAMVAGRLWSWGMLWWMWRVTVSAGDPGGETESTVPRAAAMPTRTDRPR